MPKTPELNKLAERMNRTIMERVRSMLSHAKLPKSYWVEALYTAVYLINRSPSVPLKGDVPQRVWTGKDVSYQHLRVFGCLAYMHVPKDQRSKYAYNTGSFETGNMSHYENTTSKKGTKASSFQKDMTHA